MSNRVGCGFGEIIVGESPASMIHEDEQALAFMDIRPAIPSHLLIVPKRHAAYLADLDEGTGGTSSASGCAWPLSSGAPDSAVRE